MTNKTSSQNIICFSAHYIEGRSIEPITVIEGFGLCPHLASVVKYLARAGHKTCYIHDLLKAQWYLDREIKRCKAPTGPCASHSSVRAFSIQEILEDWKLIPYLEAVLSYILTARIGFKGNYSRQSIKSYSSSLTKAMSHLQLAIADHEQGDCK